MTRLHHVFWEWRGVTGRAVLTPAQMPGWLDGQPDSVRIVRVQAVVS